MTGNKNVRTFADFMKAFPHCRATYGESYNACRSCRKQLDEVGALWKYSVRHYLCDECIERRKDEVMPDVKRRERFEKKMRAIR